MELDKDQIRKAFAKDLTEVFITIGIIAVLVYLSVRVFSPFMGLVTWGLILAVTLYPIHQRLAGKIGDRQGMSATLLVLAGLLLIGTPTVMLGSSFAGHIQGVSQALEDETVQIPPPAESVAEWPLVGEKVYRVWSQASTSLPALLQKAKPQLTEFTKKMLAIMASTAGGVFAFLGSLIIAGIMMAYGKSGAQAMSRIICRVAGKEKGPGFYSLSTATIRSVAMGVVGVAFIQALLLGLGFMAAGVPAAGVLAILVLILGILQVPATVLTLPVIAYLWWSGDSTVMNVVWTVYLLVAGMADNVLKPLLLGRGVDAPMPIILLGALGGMVSAGLIGLFVGAVILALGYVIFMDWVAGGDDEPCEPPTATVEPDAPTAME
jgi:predicted PurR-regulated permease PerM